MTSNIEGYLPSKTFAKKVGLSILVVIVLFGLVKLSQYFKENQFAQNQKTIQPTGSPLVVKDITLMDYNKDGIADWKQNLEAALGITPQTQADQIEEAPINETEQFARDLFTTAATVSQSGELTEEGTADIAQKVTEQIAVKSLAAQFTTNDVKIVADNDTNRKNYVSALKALLDIKYPLDIDVSVVILGEALEKNDPTILNKLDPIATRYSKLIDALKLLAVPKAAAAGHVELLNRLNKTLGSIQLMKSTFTNPVVSLSASMQYSQTISDVLEYLVHFTNKLPYGNVATPIDADAAIDELGQYN